MDRLTRKELKSDRFALEVQHSVEYVSVHRQQLVRWGGVAAAVVLVVLAVFFYRNNERAARQEALRGAQIIQNANIGPSSGNDLLVTFPTPADRDKALSKAFGEIATKYPGTDEGVIAQMALASNAADDGNLAEAEKRFKSAVDSGNEQYASLAKLSLAQIYFSQNKKADGEKLIQAVIDHPTSLVSKEQATIELAELIGKSDPQRARKMLEPLRGNSRPAVSQAAINALSDLNQQK